MTFGAGSPDVALSAEQVRSVAAEAFASLPLEGRRVLVVIPDGTRSGPVGLFFRIFHELLRSRVARLDYLIALGTHQPMDEAAICRRLEVSPDDLAGRYGDVEIFNHEWWKPEMLERIGELDGEEVRQLSGGLLADPIAVTVNRRIFDYDQLIVAGPVFPHEVAGFSGGNKYFFPGISGPEVIDASHWLGALHTCRETIGCKATPVRAIIDRAASLIPLPRFYFCMVVRQGEAVGLFAGPDEEAWSRAADLSGRVHVVEVERPLRRVLAVMPPMYADIWTAAKGMYKLEPVVEEGGELIIYAPHITEVSYTHGRILDEIGYHVRDYFVKQWDRFRHHPWGVLAHSTHLRGAGSYDNGIERPRIRVTLATGISRERCRRLGLGWHDPGSICPEAWAKEEQEGVLVVPHAGEILYRLTASVSGS